MSSVTLEVVQPTGLDVVLESRVARRIDALDGKRIGLVHNGKDYGEKLLDQVQKLLQERYPTAKFSRWKLRNCCSPPAEGEIEGIARQVDAVVYGVAD